jgi:two-component system sensor histidine kinase BaeS
VSREVPLQRSLIVRLLAVSALISVCSIAATAWLAVQTTTKAIRQEQGRALAADAQVYDVLLGYAATHHDYAGVRTVVDQLAQQTGRRITLTTTAHAPLADSASGGAPALGSASATVDALSVDNQLSPATTTDRIDDRAVGPFRLPAAERARLHQAADRLADCLRAVFPAEVTVVDQPSGRPLVEAPGADPASERCETLRQPLTGATPTEQGALTKLNGLVDSCLRRHGLAAVRLDLDTGWDRWTSLPAATARREPTVPGTNDLVNGCIGTSRRELLSPYVAPPALLFVTAPGTGASGPRTFDLSMANRSRIVIVTGLVLLVALTITVLAGRRLVAPLQALIRAAQRDGGAAGPIRVRGRDEIARLTAAFNEMAARRRELEELRKAMVSDIAHEMRTPVTNIRGWLEAAEDGVVVPDRQLMSSLLEEAVLLQRVIDDLQDLAAADAGELALHPEHVGIGEVIAQTALANRTRAETAGVRVITAVSAEVIVYADPVRLRQAVGNLVTNAVRHTPPGGTVTITGSAEATAAVIEVADTGPGIPAADLPRVFERFWRGDKSRNRHTGGSGLGLAIVRKLAEAHGGTASAGGTEGHGATFSLRIPLDPRPPPTSW